MYLVSTLLGLRSRLLEQGEALLQPLARQARRRRLRAEGDGVEARRLHLRQLPRDLSGVGVAGLHLRLDELARQRRLLLQREVELDEEVAPHLAHAADRPAQPALELGVALGRGGGDGLRRGVAGGPAPGAGGA